MYKITVLGMFLGLLSLPITAQNVRKSLADPAHKTVTKAEVEAELLADKVYRAENSIIYQSSHNAKRTLADIVPTAGATESFTPAVGDHFFDPGGPGGTNSDGGAGNYPDCNCDTKTTLVGVTELEFSELNIFATFDYLRIYDGTDATGTLLFDNGVDGMNEGDNTLADMIASHGSATFTSTSGNFFFFFHASSVVNRLGWDVVINSIQGGGSNFPAPYCDITDSDEVIVEEITKVDFDGTVITNTDNTTVLLDKTDVIVDVTSEETYTLSVEGNTYGGFDNAIIAFIDWNQNGVLDDAGEVYEVGTITNSTGNDSISVSRDITVPADAMAGNTRIRISKIYFDDLSPLVIDPCGIMFNPFGMGTETSYGQALDFTLNISGGSTGDTCSEENPNGTTFEDGYNISSTTDFKSANDLTVAADEDFTLTNITASIFADGGLTNVDVVYYSDSNNLPGSVIGSQNSVTIDSQTQIGNEFGIDIYEVEMTVDPFLFSGRQGTTNKYWIELIATDAGSTGAVYWVVTSAGMNGSPAAQYDGGWTTNEDGMDGVYIFEGQCGPHDPGPDCTGTPDGGTVMVTPESGNPGSSYVVSAQDYTVGNGITYQWQSNTDGAGWVDEGDALPYYETYTATAPGDLGMEVAWRLAVTCSNSGETSYSETATYTTIIEYCTPSSSTIEAITRVVFSDIDNSSPATSTVSYEDFTSITASVQQGATYSFAAEGNTEGNYTNYFTVWIDWNQNGTFEANEYYEIGSITNSTGTDGQQAVADIQVPADAMLGDTRMRVRKNYNSAFTDPCGNNTWGQTEDYTVNVGMIGIGDNSKVDFAYYPNPVDNVLHINAKMNIESVVGFNMLGQKVLVTKAVGENGIDVSNLRTGNYIFQINFENGQVENIKVMKK